MLPEIRARGGEVFAITSQPDKKAKEATSSWDLQFRAIISDEDHIIADHARSLGYVLLLHRPPSCAISVELMGFFAWLRTPKVDLHKSLPANPIESCD